MDGIRMPARVAGRGMWLKHLLAKEVIRQGGNQRAGQDVGGDQRKDHRLREGAEQIAGHTTQSKHRHEGDADTHQRHGSRDDDLLSTVQYCCLDLLAVFEMQLMFSIVTVASSTRMPTASARPPSVMTLIVSPSSDSAVTDARMASGIETVMIRVERQLPRNNRIIIPVNAAAIAPSVITLDTALVTNTDWSPTAVSFRLDGSVCTTLGSSCLMPEMIDRVEVAPAFTTANNTALLPSTWTTLVCGGLPSCTLSTSRM